MTTNEKITLPLTDAVRNIVAQIPPGKVLTYGTIARLAGFPNHSRLVGRIMCSLDEADLPCHRVVNAVGRTAPGWAEQTTLLLEEGVAFKANGCVDLRQYLWRIEEE